MPQTVSDVLKTAQFAADDDVYRLLKLPPQAVTAAAGVIAEIGEPFCALLVDKNEVTLVIPDEAVEHFGKRLPGHTLGGTYKLITVEAELEPDLIGFMSAVSTALAGANVGVFPYAAFTTDHILVPEAQLEAALEALKSLQAAS